MSKISARTMYFVHVGYICQIYGLLILAQEASYISKLFNFNIYTWNALVANQCQQDVLKVVQEIVFHLRNSTNS